MISESKRVASWKIYAYSSSLFGFIMMMNMNTMYYTFFLTDVIFIPAALVGTILIIGRIGDMISVPIVSAIMEKTNLKWGKYRSWLLIAPPIVAICFVLMFTNPNISLLPKIIYLLAAYLIAHFFVNLGHAALYSLLPLMSKHPEDRTLIAARRTQFSSAGQIIFGYIAMPIMIFFTGKNAQVPGLNGFVITTIIFCVIMLITYWIVFCISKEFDMPISTNSTAKKPQPMKVNEMISQVFKNPPFLALIVGDICRFISLMAVTGIAAYHFRYVFSDMSILPIFLGSLGIIQLFGSLIAPYLTKLIDKRNVYILGLALVVISQFLAFFFAKDAIIFTIIVGMGFIGISFSASIGPAMYADTVEYGEWKTGKNARGFIMGMANMPPKIGLIITGSLTAFALSSMGYVAGKPATPELINGLKLLIHILPAVSAAIGLIVTLLFNKLTVSRVQQIQEEIRINTEIKES